MSCLRVLRLAAYAVVGGVVLAPTVAHAERVAVVDAAGDAQKLDWERSRKDHPVFLPAPEETSVDIVRTVVAHGAVRLAVTVRFRDLARLTDHQTSIRVVTPDGTRLDVRVVLEPGARVRTVVTRNDRAYSCPGLRAVVDQERDRIGVSLPTACLAAPRWVRVGVGADGVEDTATPDHPYAFEMYSDDGGSTALDPRSWLTLGPKVRRG